MEKLHSKLLIRRSSVRVAHNPPGTPKATFHNVAFFYLHPLHPALTHTARTLTEIMIAASRGCHFICLAPPASKRSVHVNADEY